LLSRTDGLIVASAMSGREIKFYKQLLSDGAKIVLIDRVLDGLRCSSVTTDDVQVGVLATEHLIKLGHRQIGHLRGTRASTSLQRLEGYKRALAKARIRLNKDLVRDCGFTEPEGYAAMKAWIAEGNLPTAIFAANDPAAIGAMAAMNDARLKVPDDVAFVGAGSIHYGDMLRVPLTTVAWSTAAMGQAAAELLLELLKDKRKTGKRRHIVIPPKLVVRQSSVTKN